MADGINNYDFTGAIDEVRISKVARSADWVRLQFENQKPLQTLVGPVVQSGSTFSVSPAQITVLEGKSAMVSAQAGGAQKVYWILKSEGRETLVAVDRLRFSFDAGRVAGNKDAVLQLRAIYPNETRTRDIPISILEDIPEPVFTLKAPAKWDGRSTIEVVPQIANLAAMRAKGAGDLKMEWNASAHRRHQGSHTGQTHPQTRAEQRTDDGNSHFEQRRQTHDSDGDHRRYGTKARRVDCRNTGERRKTSGQPVLRAR